MILNPSHSYSLETRLIEKAIEKLLHKKLRPGAKRIMICSTSRLQLKTVFMLVKLSLKWLKWELKENQKIRSLCQILLVGPAVAASNCRLKVTTRGVARLSKEADAVESLFPYTYTHFNQN